MRYHRQTLVPEVGETGQKLIANARVLCVGMGGLGSPASLYLAGAGVGTLGLMDADEVSVSNLHRQILYSLDEVGMKKVAAAKSRLSKLNPDIKIETYACDLNSKNIEQIFSAYDLILDGTDRFSTKLLINDACLKLNLPWVYASVSQWEGQIAYFNPKDQDAACYRCFQPELPKVQIQNCAEAGVIGPVVGILGTDQALQAIQIILELPQRKAGTLRVFDGLNHSWMKIAIQKNPHCPACSIPKSKLKLIDRAEDFCETHVRSLVTAKELAKQIQNHANPFSMIDVRDKDEWDEFHIEGATLWPLSKLEHAEYPALPQDQKVLVYCRSGMRSAKAAQILKDHGFKNVSELKNGLSEWII